MLRRTLLVSTIASGLAISPAFAQVSLITVNLQNVHLEIAKNLDINMEDVPINILLPISIAANVCGVDVGALGGGAVGSDQNTCSATNTTLATQYVRNLIGLGTDPATTDASTAEGSTPADTGTAAAPATDAPTTDAPATDTGTTDPGSTDPAPADGGTTPSDGGTAPDQSTEPAPAQ